MVSEPTSHSLSPPIFLKILWTNATTPSRLGKWIETSYPIASIYGICTYIYHRKINQTYVPESSNIGCWNFSPPQNNTTKNRPFGCWNLTLKRRVEVNIPFVPWMEWVLKKKLHSEQPKVKKGVPIADAEALLDRREQWTYGVRKGWSKSEPHTPTPCIWYIFTYTWWLIFYGTYIGHF